MQNTHRLMRALIDGHGACQKILAQLRELNADVRVQGTFTPAIKR